MKAADNQNKTGFKPPSLIDVKVKLALQSTNQVLAGCGDDDRGMCTVSVCPEADSCVT